MLRILLLLVLLSCSGCALLQPAPPPVVKESREERINGYINNAGYHCKEGVKEIRIIEQGPHRGEFETICK